MIFVEVYVEVFLVLKVNIAVLAVVVVRALDPMFFQADSGVKICVMGGAVPGVVD